MTTHAGSTGQVPRRVHRGVVPVVLGGVALVVVMVLMLLDRTLVRTQDELTAVAFGIPFTWVTQAQSLDPPLPFVTRFLSPWENPTTVDVVPLVVDVILVGLVLAAAWLGVSALRQRR